MALTKPSFKISPLDAPLDFRKALRDWFSKYGKDFPWRRTRDPYAILVSEMMLHQTRVATVLGKGYFTRFLNEFPDAPSLVLADDTRLLKAWEGLGYYRRARMLRAAVTAVMEEHGGRFPETEKEMLTLPGIGPYTAAALLSFAFGKPSALVDGNVSRVLSRLMDDGEVIELSATVSRHRQWALALCDPDDPRNHHYAMMELGQRICRPGVPLCEICPVAAFCITRNPAELPLKKKTASATEISENAIWTTESGGNLLLNCETGSRRNGLWKLPLRSAEDCSGLPLLLETTYTITRYRVRLKIFAAENCLPLEGDEWVSRDRLNELPIAAPFKKALKRLLSDL